jgi:hypothetical protein
VTHPARLTTPAIEVSTRVLDEQPTVPLVIPARARVPPPVPALLDAVAERCDISLAAIRRRYAKGPASSGKRIAVHAACELGISIAQIAAALDMTRQRGSAIRQRSLAPDEAKVMREVVDALSEVDRVYSVPSAQTAG